MCVKEVLGAWHVSRQLAMHAAICPSEFYLVAYCPVVHIAGPSSGLQVEERRLSIMLSALKARHLI